MSTYLVSLLQNFIVVWVEVYLPTPIKTTNNCLKGNPFRENVKISSTIQKFITSKISFDS